MKSRPVQPDDSPDCPRADRHAEYRKIRDAYAAQPDSESEADDWANAEEFQP
jgi:hypothetical protein